VLECVCLGMTSPSSPPKEIPLAQDQQARHVQCFFNFPPTLFSNALRLTSMLAVLINSGRQDGYPETGSRRSERKQSSTAPHFLQRDLLGLAPLKLTQDSERDNLRPGTNLNSAIPDNPPKLPRFLRSRTSTMQTFAKRAIIVTIFLIPTIGAHPATGRHWCNLLNTKLPDTNLTVAQLVPAGKFVLLMVGSRQTSCIRRVAGVIRPTDDHTFASRPGCLFQNWNGIPKRWKWRVRRPPSITTPWPATSGEVMRRRKGHRARG